MRRFPLPPIVGSSKCPRCSRATTRIPTPLVLRPLRWLAGKGSTTRRCDCCYWWGVSRGR
ncbi:MAG TPA: hypothetical protein VFE05_00700 [Longimicrobiaceae bacterium]|nr:hypothetical protein [Longimicrobiaceae bacterium]